MNTCITPRCVCVCVCGGGVLSYFHIYVDSVHILELKIFNFNIFSGFSEKNNILGYEDFVDIFFFFFGGGGGGGGGEGHRKIGLVLGVISMHLMVLSSVQGTKS